MHLISFEHLANLKTIIYDMTLNTSNSQRIKNPKKDYDLFHMQILVTKFYFLLKMVIYYTYLTI